MKKEPYDKPIMIFCFEGEDIIRTSDNWLPPVKETF